MPQKVSQEDLKRICASLRVDILQMITKAGSGHPGGSLSAIDLIAALYANTLRHDPKNGEWADRDRFVLSKGHGVPALYAVLAHHGYFSRNLLPTLRELGSPLQGHPVRGTVPGIEACTGSLGQGLSVALGIALSANVDKKDFFVFCMTGDGELQEGQVWEAVMAAAKFKSDNLVVIIDNNRGQIDGPVSEVMPIEPLEAKWQSFGWKTRRIDGHNLAHIEEAYAWAKTKEGAPKCVIADTIKGKGVSYMEANLTGWHGNAPNPDELQKALAELGAQGKVWP